MIRFGVNAADEEFYYSIARRVLQGDRLMVDEWQVSQFSTFFLMVPYRIYTAAVGSAEGIILYERILYVIHTGILYWWLCSKYRRFGYWGVAGVALFCAFVPGDMFALFYLTMGLQWLMVLATVLFLPVENAPRPAFRWFLCGVALACVVLAQPPFCFVYFLYSAAVLIFFVRAKRGKHKPEPVLAPRVWALVTAGVVTVAVPVVIYLCVKSGPGNIIRIFPELFTDAEYDFAYEHVANLFWKFLLLCGNFGYVNAVLWGLLLIAAVLVRRLRKKAAPQAPGGAKGRKKAAGQGGVRRIFTDIRFSRALFFLACVCVVSSYVCAAVKFAQNKNAADSHQIYMYYFYHAFPVVAFSAVCGKLLRERIHGFVPFWWSVVLSDLCNTYGSQVSCSVCGVLLYPWTFYVASRLIKELREAAPAEAKANANRKKETARRLLAPALAAGICACVCFECIGLYAMRFTLPIEHYESGDVGEPVDTVLRRGPEKGLITNRRIAQTYEAFLSDLDRLNGMGDGRVYVMEAYPGAYLYMNRKVGSYSAWFVEDDALDRELRYMQLLPENRPALVYVPRIDFTTYRMDEKTDELTGEPVYKKKLEWVRHYADCTVTEGAVGYLVKINAWRLPPAE